MKDAPDFDDLNFLFMPYDLDVDGTEFQSCYLKEVARSLRPARLSANQKLALDTLISGTSRKDHCIWKIGAPFSTPDIRGTVKIPKRKHFNALEKALLPRA